MIEQLEARRSFECRLTPDRALTSLDEAADWVRDRGLVVRTPDCALPSLHVACHEEAYAPDKPGFGQYPKTNWWWGWALAERPGLRWLRIRGGGKNVMITDANAALVDSLAREELAGADEGRFGEESRRLVRHLAAAGPSFVEELREELSLDTKSLRGAREPLERVAAVVARQVLLETGGGRERYATELARWDQLGLAPASGGLDALLLAGVRAAVLAPEDEARRWFSWRHAAADVDCLVDAGRLGRAGGLLYAI